MHSPKGALLPPSGERKSPCGISPGFPRLSPTSRQVAHVLRTRSPLDQTRRPDPVRLACVKRAASVRPEPGSNSPLELNCSGEQNASVSFGNSRFKPFEHEDVMPHAHGTSIPSHLPKTRIVNFHRGPLTRFMTATQSHPGRRVELVQPSPSI